VIATMDLPLDRRLQRAAMIVVKRFVQEKHVVDLHLEHMELPAQLLESVRAKPACDQGANVLGAKIDLDGAAGMQREGDVAHGAQMMADRTATAIGPLDHRVAFAHR